MRPGRAAPTRAPLPANPASTRLSPNRALGQHLAAQHGWAGKQWACLLTLWNHESQWNHRALNDNTGNQRFDPGMIGRYGDAYGIAQALPPNKMAAAGPDWRTNPATQIRWGLGYIAGRYGTPCTAWAFWQRQDDDGGGNWY